MVWKVDDLKRSHQVPATDCLYPRCQMQRAYHFVPLCHGLNNLRHRRLKIAQLDELNDPFELWAISQPDPDIRKSLKMYKTEMARHYGLLCFSLNWHNPVQWSHYADRHKGLALGFDIDEALLRRVSYQRSRSPLAKVDVGTAQSLLFTKYIDWEYEKEARIYTRLEQQDSETNLYFADFSDQLALREVIAGPMCGASEQQLFDAVGSTTGVIFLKARLAFKTFSVVADRRGFDLASLDANLELG